MTDTSAAYDHRVAHAETIKVVNNRYSTPVTLKFDAVTKERTINIAHKPVIIFSAIKLLESTATIKSSKGIVYHSPKDFHAEKHMKMILKLSSIIILTPNNTSMSNISSNLHSILTR